jgi:hypothetical protein
METILLIFMIFSLLVIFTVDTRQKRDQYLNQGK